MTIPQSCAIALCQAFILIIFLKGKGRGGEYVCMTLQNLGLKTIMRWW